MLQRARLTGVLSPLLPRWSGAGLTLRMRCSPHDGPRSGGPATIHSPCAWTSWGALLLAAQPAAALLPAAVTASVGCD
jgi:hypothetical protein